jgi:adenylylsulfate kinase-like enzyme
MSDGDFVEVHVKASLETCRARDPKGLYEQADAGKIAEFTGVAAPYEAPESPELVLDTERDEPELGLQRLLAFLEAGGYIRAESGDT